MDDDSHTPTPDDSVVFLRLNFNFCDLADLDAVSPASRDLRFQVESFEEFVRNIQSAKQTIAATFDADYMAHPQVPLWHLWKAKQFEITEENPRYKEILNLILIHLETQVRDVWTKVAERGDDPRNF